MNVAWCFLAVLTAAPSQEEILQHMRANTQHTLPPVQFTYRVDTDWTWSGWGEHRPHAERFLDITTLRSNAETVTVIGEAERIDIANEFSSLYVSDIEGRIERGSSNRRFWDGTTAYYWVSEARNPPQKPTIFRDPSPANWAWTKARGLPGAPALSATFPGDAQTLADHIERSEDVEIHDALESVDGVACVRVTISNERGAFTVWLDPDASYLMRKARVIKSRDHLVYRDDKPVHAGLYMALADARVDQSEWEYAYGESMETSVDRVEIREIGGHYFIASARIVQEVRYDKGRIERRSAAMTMEAIELNPDFEASGAFTISSLPEVSLTKR